MTRFSRAQLLSRTAKGGLALAVGGGVLSAVSSPASAAIGPGDVPEVTQALAAELLGVAFYTQLLAAKVFRADEQKYFARALVNENEHYTAMAKFLTDAGQTPGTADDFNFTFPKGAFSARKPAAELGLQLETIFLGIYLGGVDALQDGLTRSIFARVAASQAHHVSLFSSIVLNKPIGLSFPVPLSLPAGSAALDPFIS